MNLIEQFGYDGVKNALQKLREDRKDLITVGRAVYVESEICDILLEHRRQHNIFEVGDLITHPAYDWKILKVHDPIPSEGILFAKTNDHVKHHWGKGLVFDDRGVVCVSYYECRHATDAEIEAGCRL